MEMYYVMAHGEPMTHMDAAKKYGRGHGIRISFCDHQEELCTYWHMKQQSNMPLHSLLPYHTRTCQASHRHGLMIIVFLTYNSDQPWTRSAGPCPGKRLALGPGLFLQWSGLTAIHTWMGANGCEFTEIPVGCKLSANGLKCEWVFRCDVNVNGCEWVRMSIVFKAYKKMVRNRQTMPFARELPSPRRCRRGGCTTPAPRAESLPPAFFSLGTPHDLTSFWKNWIKIFNAAMSLYFTLRPLVSTRFPVPRYMSAAQHETHCNVMIWILKWLGKKWRRKNGGKMAAKKCEEWRKISAEKWRENGSEKVRRMAKNGGGKIGHPNGESDGEWASSKLDGGRASEPDLFSHSPLFAAERLCNTFRRRQPWLNDRWGSIQVLTQVCERVTQVQSDLSHKSARPGDSAVT